MRRRALATMTALLTSGGCATAVASAAPGEAAVTPTASIVARLVPGQQVPGPDWGRIAVAFDVTARADCTRGCDVVWSEVTESGAPVTTVLDSRTFGPSATQHYTVRHATQLGKLGARTIRFVQRTAAGTRDLAFVQQDGVQLPEAGPDTTLGGDWRRVVDLTATQTMTLRSSARGSAASFGQTTGGSNMRRYGVVAETGPTGGVLGVYVDGALAARVDLRSAEVVHRKVVAVFETPPGGHTLHRFGIVNLTPTTRPDASVNFDGFVLVGSYSLARTAGREPMAPIRVNVLDQVLSRDVAAGRVSMRVSATVTGCADGCELRWGSKVIASATFPAGATKTLSATIAPSIRHSDGQPLDVSLYRGGEFAGFAYVQPDLDSLAAGNFANVFSSGWSVASRPGVLNGGTVETSARDAGFTSMLEMYDPTASRTVAIVSARGPQMGVMGVYRDGILVKTIDLRSATYQPRAVVASVTLGHRGRVTIVNATPAGRSADTITLDELLTIGYDD